VKIFNEAQSFEASATVAYSLTHLGMALSLEKFRQIRATSCESGCLQQFETEFAAKPLLPFLSRF
jgi:hypothetical protein